MNTKSAGGNFRRADRMGRVREALSAAGNKKIDPLDLPFTHFRYADQHSAIEIRIENTRWRCDLKTYACAIQQQFHPGDREHESCRW